MRTKTTLAAVFIVSSYLSGCAMPWPRSDAPPLAAEPPAPTVIAEPTEPLPTAAENPTDDPPEDETPAELWSRIRDGLALAPVADGRIADGLALHRRYPRHLNRTARKHTAQLTYVLEEITARNYPTELALLPVVESRYNPRATSRYGAAGLWQIMPATARRLGVNFNHAYDGRRDMVTSTRAALRYLETLHDKYDGDWLLALAAYNCGDGTVDRVIRNHPDVEPDYWAIERHLPRETRLHVERLLALASIVRSPDRYGIDLPPLEPAPPLEVVEVQAPVDVSQVPAAVGLTAEDFFALNSGLQQPAIGQRFAVNVVVPLGTAADARDALQRIAETSIERTAPAPVLNENLTSYVVKRGDTLSGIALRYGVPVRRLRDLNGLESDRIRAGRRLRIPGRSREVARHRVEPGDSLWSIARRHGTTVRQLQALNELRQGATLKPGQVIRLPAGETSLSAGRDI